MMELRPPGTQLVETETAYQQLRVGGNQRPDRLLNVVQLFWAARGRIARFAIAGAVITLLVVLLTPNVYVSTTELMPPDNQSSGFAALAGLASRLGGAGGGNAVMPIADLLGMKTSGALFIGILDSRTVQDAIVDRFDLQRVYGYPLLHLRARREDARKRLAQNTSASEDRKSGIITLSVQDHDPKRAAALAQSYVNQLDALVAGLSTSSARREREFLESRLKDVKQELDKAAKALGEFSSKNSTLDPRDQGKAMIDAAAKLQGELIAAQSQLSGLEAIYTSNNVRVRTLRARIVELKKQLAFVSGSTPATSNELEGMPSIRQLPILGLTYSDLYRRTKVQEIVFELLTQQYEMAKVQEAKEIPTVRVLDQPVIPERKSGPHRALWTISGAFIGLLLGALWVIGAAQWQAMDRHNPYKVLVSEIAGSVRAHRWWRGSELRLRNLAASPRWPLRRRDTEADPLSDA